MSKSITFTYGGKDYRLEFTKATVVKMEEQGFMPQMIVARPVGTISALWKGSFLANHPNVSEDLMWEMYEAIGGKADSPDGEGLVSALVEMYNEPMEGLTAEPDDSVKVTWEKSW